MRDCAKRCFPISHLVSGGWGRGLVVAPGVIHVGLHMHGRLASYLARQHGCVRTSFIVMQYRVAGGLGSRWAGTDSSM